MTRITIGSPVKSHRTTGKSSNAPAVARKLLAACLAVGLALPSHVFAQPAPAAPPVPAASSRPAAVVPSGTAVSPELKGRTVEDVRVVGNVTVPTAVIRNVIRTDVGQPFDPATVEEDYQRIYELKKFANVTPRVEPSASGVIVTFQVDEQKQIRAVRFKGNAHVDNDALASKVIVKSGEAIDSYRINLARQAIQLLYRDRNYPFTHVEVDQKELEQNSVLVFNVVEGPHVTIRKVEVIGNHSFSDDKIKDQVKTRSWFIFINPGKLEQEQVDDDVVAIRQFYREKGFFDARVGRKLTFSLDQTEVMVSFLIDEGSRYMVDRVSFRGNHAVSEADLRKVLKMNEGRFYDAETLRRDIKAIVRAYPKGYIYQQQSSRPEYLNIDSKTVFRKEPGKVELIYDISEGQQFRIGRILVRGNAKVQDKVYLREMRVDPGDLYDSSELQDAVERIRGTQLATGVQITPVGEAPGVRDVLVEVKEAQTAFFMIGAGITSNAGVLGNISLEQRNFDIANVPGSWGELFSSRAFTGAGQYFKIQLEPGTQQSRASIRFTEPYILDQPYALDVNLYYQTFIREYWDENRAGGRISIGKRFTNDLIGRINLRGEDIEIRHFIDDINRAPEILASHGHHSLTSAGLDLRYDTTDSPILPSRGLVAEGSWEHAGALGAQYNFDKFTADLTLHQLVGEDLLDRKTTLTERIAAGYTTNGTPFFERFYGGGLGSIRGFRYRGISPRAGPHDDPIGGFFTLAGTVELNFPLFGEMLRGVVFADAGTVEQTVTINTIRASIGAGVRITLPLFGQVPLALDLAIPISKASQDDKQLFSFSLGISQ